MAKTTNAARNGGQLQQLINLDATVERSAGQSLLQALQYTSLRLPDDGAYYLEQRGKTLHVYGVDKGISRYDFKDKNEPKSFQASSESITIEVSGGRVNEIILHLKPTQLKNGLIALEELSAPVDLLDEYGKLSGKDRLTPAELDRKREILRELSKEFRKSRENGLEYKRGTSSSSSSGSYSGESRGGGYVSNG